MCIRDRQSLDYIKVILLGFVITVLNNLFMSVLQSLGDSPTPFWALLVSSVTNIGLDCVFVLTLKWGVQGAAAATVLSQVFSFAICAAGLKRLKFVSILDGSKSKNARLTVRMLKTGLPVGIMSMVTAVGGMILQFFVNDLGASAVAAYAASTKIRSVIGEFSNALGMTFMTFVGQNYGAQKYDRIKAGVRMGVLLSILIHIPLSAVEIFGGKRIASLMVTDPPVLELCRQYLLIVGIFVFFLGFLMVFRNCIQGMGNTWIPMLSGGLEGRYWLGKRSNREVLTGHFLGLYAGGGKYDLQWKEKGYQGEFFIAAGLSYGYARRIARNLHLEFNLGIGLMRTDYRHYRTRDNYQTLLWQENGNYTWLGPTKVKVSLVWLLTRRKAADNK